jgi:hypothetical protein
LESLISLLRVCILESQRLLLIDRPVLFGQKSVGLQNTFRN